MHGMGVIKEIIEGECITGADDLIALRFSASYGCLKEVRRLLSKPEINTKIGKRTNTALKQASRREHLEVMHELLRYY